MKTLLISTFILISNIGLSQDTTTLIMWADSVQVIKIKNHSDETAKLHFWGGGATGLDRASFGGVSYYWPKKAYFNINIGYGVIFDGSIYLKSKTKEAFNGMTLKNKKGDYKFRPLIIKRKLFGIHYGFGRSTIPHYLYATQSDHVAMGLTLASSSSGHWKFSSKHKQRRGSTFVNLNLDGLYFFKNYFPTPPELLNQEIGEPPINEILIAEAHQKDAAKGERTFGFRLYIEGNTGLITRSGILGLKYLIGFGRAPHESINFIQLGAGLSFSFL